MFLGAVALVFMTWDRHFHVDPLLPFFVTVTACVRFWQRFLLEIRLDGCSLSPFGFNLISLVAAVCVGWCITTGYYTVGLWWVSSLGCCPLGFAATLLRCIIFLHVDWTLLVADGSFFSHSSSFCTLLPPIVYLNHYILPSCQDVDCVSWCCCCWFFMLFMYLFQTQ